MNELFERIDGYTFVVIFGASKLGQLIYHEIESFCNEKRKASPFR